MVLQEYRDERAANPFAAWFGKLGSTVALRVTIALRRMEAGNFSNTKSVGAGVHEFRIDTGPGYRIYFGREGDDLIILLAGGTKRRQDRDIEDAKAHWADHKRMKRES